MTNTTSNDAKQEELPDPKYRRADYYINMWATGEHAPNFYVKGIKEFDLEFLIETYEDRMKIYKHCIDKAAEGISRLNNGDKKNLMSRLIRNVKDRSKNEIEGVRPYLTLRKYLIETLRKHY